MTEEQKVLESWTPDYTNDEGEEFYEKGKVAIILSEYRQSVVKSVSSNSCVMLCWVSVLERLPDESDYYIVFSTAGIHIEWFRKEDGKFGARNGSEVLATYWMAKPPKPNRA